MKSANILLLSFSDSPEFIVVYALILVWDSISLEREVT